MTMDAIATFHSVELMILLTRAGARSDGDLKMTCIAERRGGAGTARSAKVSRSAWFPHREVKTLEAALYRILYEIDLDCGQMWAQASLFE